MSPWQRGFWKGPRIYSCTGPGGNCNPKSGRPYYPSRLPEPQDPISGPGIRAEHGRQGSPAKGGREQRPLACWPGTFTGLCPSVTFSLAGSFGAGNPAFLDRKQERRGNTEAPHSFGELHRPADKLCPVQGLQPPRGAGPGLPSLDPAPWATRHHLRGGLPTLPQGPMMGHPRYGTFLEPGPRQSLPSQVRLRCKVCRWEAEAKVKGRPMK